MNINDSGMAKPLTDREYFDMMTSNGEDSYMVAAIIKLYPTLAVFSK